MDKQVQVISDKAVMMEELKKEVTSSNTELAKLPLLEKSLEDVTTKAGELEEIKKTLESQDAKVAKVDGI